MMQHSYIALIHFYQCESSVPCSCHRFFSIGCCSNAINCHHWSYCIRGSKKKETDPVSLYAPRISHNLHIIALLDSSLLLQTIFISYTLCINIMQHLLHGSSGACDKLVVKYTVVNVKLYCSLLLHNCVYTRIYTVEGQEGTREVGWEHSHIDSTHANEIHLCTITQAHYNYFRHNT